VKQVIPVVLNAKEQIDQQLSPLVHVYQDIMMMDKMQIVYHVIINAVHVGSLIQIVLIVVIQTELLIILHHVHAILDILKMELITKFVVLVNTNAIPVK
jgi:hypothetical protein